MISLATAVGLVLVGYWPTGRLAGLEGQVAMLLGVTVALLGAWAGSLPTVLYLRKAPQEHPTGILAGLGVRFGVTMALALAVWLSDAVTPRPLILWIGIAQFVILGVDVTGLIALLKQAAKENS